MYPLVLKTARAMAFVGGLVLTGLVLMTCVSVAGRALNKFFNGDWAQAHITGLANWALEAGVAPVWGDVEVLEAGVGFAVFAFIPLCQISGAHAKVDLFTSGLKGRAERVLNLCVDLLFAVVLCVMAWRLEAGMAEKAQYSETSFMLQLPVWWAYALCLVPAVMAAVVAVYMVAARGVEVITNRDVIPAEKAPAS